MNNELMLKTFNEASKSIWEMTNRGYANYMIHSAAASYMADLNKLYGWGCPICEAENKAEVVGKENQLGFNF